MNTSLKHDYLVTNKIKLHYVSQGEGELILFLHGFPEFWYSWRHQIPEFAKDYKVVAVDLRGYNESDKPKGINAYTLGELNKDIEGIIQGLGYDRCILVGHDWGGIIAWSFAHTYPNQVDKLIIMNAPHPAKFGEALRKNPQQMLKSSYIAFFQLPWLPEFLFRFDNYSLIAKAFISNAVDKTAFTVEDLEAYKESAAKKGSLTAMINYYRTIPRALINQPQWHKLSLPILLIWGEKDPFLGKELTENTEDYAENLQIHYISDGSHWIQQEKPLKVNQAMRQFISG